jgi:hypothetical protein
MFLVKPQISHKQGVIEGLRPSQIKIISLSRWDYMWEGDKGDGFQTSA